VRVVVDPELCAGHGRCYSVAPSLFSADDEGFPLERGIVRAVGPADGPAARLAVRSCPEGAVAEVTS
jgi:ferredoxin